MKPLTRDLAISLGTVIVLVSVILVFGRSCQSGVLGSLELRVVNDTARTVQIQPCWDVQCLDTHGLPPAVLRPRASKDETWLPNVGGGVVVVGVQRPGAKPWQIAGCLISTYAPGQKLGTVRLSQQRACFQGGG